MNNLDDSMSESQASQFMREKFPPQKDQMRKESPAKNKAKGKEIHPRDDKEMLSKLMTMAKDQPAVFKTLNLIKTTATYEQNTKNLTASNKDKT